MKPLNSFFWKDALLKTLGLGLLFLILLTQVFIAFNKSPSLRHDLFLCLKGLPLERGDIVNLINHPVAVHLNTPHTSVSHTSVFHTSVTKRIWGFPGERIIHHKDFLIVTDGTDTN